MKSILFVLLFALPAAVFARPAEPVTTVLKIRDGQQLLVQISKAEAGKPTFLFLPGVNRSLLLNEPAAKKLIGEGYGVAAFNFSSQPLSVATLKPTERPAFYREEVTLETLAAETEAVASALKAQYGVERVIPVTLSYSGAVSRSLNFRFVIDSVPLTSTRAFSPQLAMYRNWLNTQALFMGLMGPAYVRTMLDAAYSMQWNPQVDSITAQFNLPPRKSEMVDGYIRLSRASEDFEWDNRGDRVKRVFILAGNENPSLLASQLEVIRARRKAGAQEATLVVMESGHVIPADQPGIYAEILKRAAASTLKDGVTIITPSTGTWKELNANDSLVQIEAWLTRLPKGSGTGSSDSPGNGGVHGTL